MLMIPECQHTIQQIGLASLGATEKELQQLASAYWYTFEVGLCLDDDGKSRKILGGAVLTSLEESELAMSSKAKVKKFDLNQVINE